MKIPPYHCEILDKSYFFTQKALPKALQLWYDKIGTLAVYEY